MYQDTIAISVCASDSPLMRSLAPRTGCAVAEYLCREYGYDALIMHDTLTSHANAYSELSLLLRRLPGRDGLPADIFYTHARILERAGRFRDFNGSITAIPVVDLDNGDLSEYLPTNIVSITDGQAVFLAELFSEGKKPALDTSQSVSRLGGAVQPAALKKPSALLKLQLTQIAGVRRVSGVSSDVDPDTKATLKRGLILDEILKQDINESYTPEKTLFYILAGCSGVLDSLEEEEVRPTLERLFETVDKTLIYEALKEGRALDATQLATIESLTSSKLEQISQYAKGGSDFLQK
jgi:F-type H+-transporting ATPase subunit alpha